MSKKNVVSIEDRIPKLKQARKKKANRRLIFYLSLFFLLILIVVYLQSSLSNIKQVNVHGNESITEDEIIELSGLKASTNIWAMNKKKAIKSIQNNPMIHSATISRSLPQAVNIEVEEYDLVGFVQKNDHYFSVIEDGEIIRERKLKSIRGEAPLLINFSEKDYLQDISKELQTLPSNILSMISELHWKPTEENKNKILLYMNDGNIVSSTIRGFSNKMAVYPSIVSQLDSDSKGIIHIGSGAYFESFDKEDE